MRMVNASFPSSPMLSLTTRSVKSIQDSVPGGCIVIVVPSVKSESVATSVKSDLFIAPYFYLQPGEGSSGQ